jgi:glutamine amidotransferase
MSIVIIKYNAGNVFSVESAVKRLGGEVIITDNKELIRKADKIIFPGQGEAGNTMRYLCEHGLDDTIRNLTRPTLGICIGMQLLCAHSEESDTPCLGVFDGVNVQRFIPQKHEDKVPHMGWNTIADVKSPLFDASVEGRHVYFVHSYYAPLSPYTIATTDYIQPFSAALRKDNFFATQFHPEKSGDTGEIILRNFLYNC